MWYYTIIEMVSIILAAECFSQLRLESDLCVLSFLMFAFPCLTCDGVTLTLSGRLLDMMSTWREIVSTKLFLLVRRSSSAEGRSCVTSNSRLIDAQRSSIPQKLNMMFCRLPKPEAWRSVSKWRKLIKVWPVTLSPATRRSLKLYTHKMSPNSTKFEHRKFDLIMFWWVKVLVLTRGVQS